MPQYNPTQRTYISRLVDHMIKKKRVLTETFPLDTCHTEFFLLSVRDILIDSPTFVRFPPISLAVDGKAS